MAFSRKDYKELQEEETGLGPYELVDLDESREPMSEDMSHLTRGKNVRNNGVEPEAEPSRKFYRSASISMTPDTGSKLSFILDMDKEEATEYSQTLHDDVDKLFEEAPKFKVEDLTSGGDLVSLGRGLVEDDSHMTADKHFDEKDFKSHRRASFPHAHVPLKSMTNKSLKATKAMPDLTETTAKKKKVKKKKPVAFSSKLAMMQQPSIPEVEEYLESENSLFLMDDDEEEEGQSQGRDLVDSAVVLSPTSSAASMPFSQASQGTLPFTVSPRNSVSEQDFEPVWRSHAQEESESLVPLVITEPFPEPAFNIPLVITEPFSEPVSSPSLVVIEPEPVPQPVQSIPFPIPTPGAGDVPSITVTQSEKTSPVQDRRRAPAFYIGFDPEGHEGSPGRSMSRSFVTDTSEVSADRLSEYETESTATEGTPFVSPAVSRRPSEVQTEDRSSSRVKFQLGDEGGLADTHEDSWAQVPVHQESNNLAVPQEPPKPSRSDTKLHKHHKRHHHHHAHYKKEDLLLRRQKGSDVQLSDAIHRVPTETEEAMMLHKADLDEMASHRREDIPGMRRHKIARKKHSTHTVASVVQIGKPDKSTVRKYFRPNKKKYDHSPHEVFVELDELFEGENQEMQWKEKARWIKFEEDVEEGAERWGKPHVASLSFHSLLELRKGLENGSLMLDLEASDLPTILHHLVENMVIHDQIRSEVKGQVMRTLLMKHKHIPAPYMGRRGALVPELARRASMVPNLARRSSIRHQRNQLNLMKTLSSSSFASMSSSPNLQGMHHPNRSLSIPNERITHHDTHGNHTVQNNHDKTDGGHVTGSRGNKEKESKNSSSNNVKKLEFVKVDVDNNTPAHDGVHIGIVAPDQKDQKHFQDIMRRIPRGAEACTVLVGCVDFLEKPAMGFIRLAESMALDNLTEVPLPVRFIFVLLGPEKTDMDYHEVGRSISTLMSNQHFHDVVYKAETRSEILHAINEFLNESIVLPPGDWDQKTLLPITDMARKRARIRRRKQKKQEELEALIKKEEKEKVPLDPLKRTGRLFGGLINDIKRRYPYYGSDYKDAFNLQCVMAFIFIFFACLAPCIAFGGLYGEKTYGHMGVTETVLSTSLTGIIFGLFSTQPLLLMGSTGPVLVFEKHLYAFCKTSHIEFLPWRVWIGIWVFLITLLVLAVEGSFLVRYITRFTEEVFAMLISLIFIVEVIHKLEVIYAENPLKSNYCDIETETLMVNSTSNETESGLNYTTVTSAPNISVVTVNGSQYSMNKDSYEGSGDQYSHHPNGHYYQRKKNEPNTALLSTILILGTFLIAYFLRKFRNSKFLGRSARRALGDFGLVLAIVLMVLFDYFCADTYTYKLDLPDTFGPTDRGARDWFISPLGIKKQLEVWHMFVAIIPAFLIFILIFLELQLTEMLLHKKEFKMKKGSGFHMGQFLAGVTMLLQSMFGLPWMCAATVRTIAHVSALSVMSRTHAPGEKPKLIEVKEQRVTSIVLNIMIGTSLFWGPLLRAVPMAVLFGVFLYLGVSAISGVQLFTRFKLLFMPVKHHPTLSYVRRVRTSKMHLFTIIQISLVAILYIVKSTIAAIVFPLLVFLMIPMRLRVLTKLFTHEELEVLDKEEEDSDADEDFDPDFYQQAHMPI